MKITHGGIGGSGVFFTPSVSDLDAEPELATCRAGMAVGVAGDAGYANPDGNPVEAPAGTVFAELELEPAPGSCVRVEVALPPAERWDGRLVGIGNGGGGGWLPSKELGAHLRRGRATTTTDLGTKRDPARSGVGNREVWKDFGHRATHLAMVAGRALAAACYGRPPRFAYFVGGSTGGRQGLDLARRRDGGGAVLERRGEEQAGRRVVVRGVRHEDVRMPVPVPVEPDWALSGGGEVEIHVQLLEPVRDAGAALVVTPLGGERVGAARAEPERAVGARARRTRLEHRGLAEHARPLADEGEVASAVFLDREGAAREAHLVRPGGEGAAEIEVDRAVGIVRARDERLVEPLPAGVRNDVDERILGCGRGREGAQRNN